MILSRRRLWAWVLVAFVLAAGALVAFLRRDKPVTVQTSRVVRQDLVSIVTASGEIKPKVSVNVSAMAYGQITEVAVREGDRVARGRLLARLESVQPAADVEAQRAALRSAEAEAQAGAAATRSAEAAHRTAQADQARSRAEHEKARREFDRIASLVRSDLASRSDYDGARASLSVAEASILRARAQVGQTYAQFDQARAQEATARMRIAQAQATLQRLSSVLTKHTVVAPIGGVVTHLPVHVGEHVVVGIQNSPGSLLMTIADMSVMTAEVRVDETDILSVKVGQRTEVTIDALPGKTLAGTVTEVGNSAILRSTGVATSQGTGSSQEARDFKVVAVLTDPPVGLRPGLSATARIQTAERKGALTMPLAALTIRKASELSGPAAVKPAPGAVGPGVATASTAPGVAPAAGAGHPEAGRSGAGTALWAGHAGDGKKEVQGVFVVRGGLALFVPVGTGIMGVTDIEVAAGLAEADEVVSGSFKVLRTLKPGAQVEVKNDVEATKDQIEDEDQ